MTILSMADKKVKGVAIDQLRDMAACNVFEKILQIIGDSKTTISLKSPKNIILRLTALAVLVFVLILEIFGKLAIKLGHRSGERVTRLVKYICLQSWVYGCPIKPDFEKGKIEIEKLKGYNAAVTAYCIYEIKKLYRFLV